MDRVSVHVFARDGMQRCSCDDALVTVREWYMTQGYESYIPEAIAMGWHAVFLIAV